MFTVSFTLKGKEAARQDVNKANTRMINPERFWPLLFIQFAACKL